MYIEQKGSWRDYKLKLIWMPIQQNIRTSKNVWSYTVNCDWGLKIVFSVGGFHIILKSAYSFDLDPIASHTSIGKLLSRKYLNVSLKIVPQAVHP